jgi:hypothetical protein
MNSFNLYTFAIGAIVYSKAAYLGKHVIPQEHIDPMESEYYKRIMNEGHPFHIFIIFHTYHSPPYFRAFPSLPDDIRAMEVVDTQGRKDELLSLLAHTKPTTTFYEEILEEYRTLLTELKM